MNNLAVEQVGEKRPRRKAYKSGNASQEGNKCEKISAQINGEGRKGLQSLRNSNTGK